MMNSLMLNINGIELKKLTPAMDTSGSVEKKFRRLNGRSSSNHSNADVLTTTISAFNSDKDKESSRHEVIETQFVPIGSQFTTVHTSPSIVMQHQSLQQHPQQPTSSETVPPILSDIEVLSAENQKLSSIARLCIHLVDRCRTLNKSKQFSEDLTKLGSLIDDFNRCNTRRGSSLPTFNNSGLVFQNPVVQANNNNLIYIPIQSTSDHSQQMVQQFLASGEKGNIRGGKGSKVRKQSNQFSEQHQQIEQSILFKKLTDSGQLLTTEIGKVDATSGGNTFTIPLSINDQNALFSIVNQIDNSNIENTPAKSNKVFKCDICMKMFANSYNLNRHMKSHSGFQPYVCVYPDCHKRFNYNYHLKRHMETHTGERPFVCTWPDCDQRFNRKYNLNRHLWVHTENKHKVH